MCLKLSSNIQNPAVEIIAFLSMSVYTVYAKTTHSPDVVRNMVLKLLRKLMLIKCMYQKMGKTTPKD